VLLGNGDGTFQAVQTYNSGAFTTNSITVGDVNGDGKPDVVVASSCISGTSCDNGIVGVLLGKGDGTFAAAQNYSSGGQVTDSVAVADVDGDGKLDLLVANLCSAGGCFSGTGRAGVLLGNGDGTFHAAQTYNSGGCEPTSIAAVDVNGDGKTDLLLGNAFISCGDLTKGAVAVLLGNGNGTFQAAQGYDPGGSEAESIAVADVNGDGKPDLLVSSASGVAGVLLGNGDGTFLAVHTYLSGGFLPLSVAVGDVNGDGKPDLLVGNDCLIGSKCPNGIVGVLLGNGDGTFLAARTYKSGAPHSRSIALMDSNGDTRTDLVVANGCSGCADGSVSVLLSTARYRTTTGLTSAPNPSVQGQALTLTATVTSAGPIAPTGRVTFKNSGVGIGSATLSNGVAILTKKNLPIGTLSITATYSGDTQSAKSTSSVLIQVVNPPAEKPQSRD
jgi:hypothetical protein